MPWKVHGIETSRPTTSRALTRVALEPAERASQIAPMTETSRIGSALRITIGLSVRCSTTAPAGARTVTARITPSHSAKELRRETPAKTRAGSTTIAMGAPYSTSSPVQRSSPMTLNCSAPALPSASLLSVIQANGLPSRSRLNAVHRAMT